MYTKPTSKMKYRGHQYDGLNNLIQTFNPYLNVGQDLSSLISNRQSKDLYDLNYNDYLSAYEVVTPEIEKAARQEALNSVNAYKNTLGNTLGTTLGQAAAGIGTGIEFAQGAMRDYSDLDTTNPDNVKNVIYGTGNVVQNLGANLFNRHNTFIEGMDDSHFDFNHNIEGTTPLADAWNNQNLLSLNTKPRQSFKEAVGDNLKAQAKGAMIGSTFGPVGTAVGAAVGFVGDIANKLFANRNYKDIAKANAERNRRLLNEANESAVWANKNWNMKNMINYSALGGKLFDQGGTMLNRFETGGSHEENPYGGILQGVAPDGQPNLVEQGETKWNDENYIFSRRLKVNKQLAKEFNLPKEFIGKSFANAISKWGERFKEMENDALSIATQNAIYTRASEAQEALRANKMMKQLNEQMANLTPEEQQTLLMQMQQQPMETQQMQYPMGSETMQGGIPQGYALGGHLFSGEDLLKQYIKDQYPADTDEAVNQWLAQITANPERYETSLKRYLENRGYVLNPEISLWQNVNVLGTSNQVDKSNTETEWSKNYKNRQVIRNKTGETPQPETIHNTAFQSTISDVFVQKVQNIKNSDKSVAEKRKEIKKLADEWNEYNKLYSELYTISTDKKETDPEVQKKVKEMQTKFDNWELNKALTEQLQKELKTVTSKNEIPAYQDNPTDSIWGERTNARYLDARTQELLDEFNSVGINVTPWDNDVNALHDYLTPTVATKYQTLNPDYNPADVNSSKYIDIEIPSEIANNPDRIKDYLAQQGYVSAGSDSTIPEDVFYYTKNDGNPEGTTENNTEGTRETPDLLPTGIRNIGAVLPFLFANQKSEYPRPLQAPMIGFSPIADYLQYRPLDKQYYLNTANARQQNLRNNLINMSGGNRAAAANRLMLADLQAQDEAGKLYRMAEEYNADQRAKVAQQNAAINEFNSKGFYGADEWNARTAYDAATKNWNMNNNIDVMTAQARSANLTQGIQNLIEIGNENARLNMINSNPAYAAGLDPKFAVAFKKLIEDSTKGTNAKCGGYLTIKKRK